MSLEEFEKELKRRKVSEKTIYTYKNILNLVEEFLGKPLDKTTTREDIEKYLNSISNMKPNTIALRLITLKVYFKWLYKMKKGYPDIVDFSKPKNHSNSLISSDLLTEEDILKLINACDNPRDKALISLLFDSACRRGEIGNLNIEDVIIETDKTGYLVVSEMGKTGKRQVPLSFSIPSLKDWINNHPLKDNPKAPLFCALRKDFGHRIAYVNLSYLVVRACKRAGISKRVFCHLFRHTRLTQLDKKGLSHTAMKYYAGWSRNSNMPSVYSHFSAQDTKELIYQADGLTPIKQKKTILEPVICAKCNTPNDKTNKYCYLCGMGLDQDSQKEFETQELIKFVIKQNPDLAKDIFKAIEKLKDVKK